MSVHLKKNKKGVSQRVAVILGYYNGNEYLSEQLKSVLEQSHRNLSVHIYDDCSSAQIDVEKLELSSDDFNRVNIKVRPCNVGCTNNFLEALSEIDSSFEYFAFSDQDDIWHLDKVEDALSALNQYPEDRPVLYCARTAITDKNCIADLGVSPLFKEKPSFSNALVQNIGGGNTMVLNKSARDLIVQSSPSLGIVSHDWWCYQVVSGANGIVHYDAKPCLKYRQHDGNLVGSNDGWGSRFKRIRDQLKGKSRNWNDINLDSLSNNKALLTISSQQRLNDFIVARKSRLLRRLFLSKRSGVYRQTVLGNIGLIVGIVINKI